MPTEIFVGDIAKYEFVSWILPEVSAINYKTKPLWIYYSDFLKLEEKEDRWIIGTPMIIPDSEIYVPIQKDSYKDIPQNSETKFYLFEEFPFKKENNVILYEMLKLQLPDTSILMVLMDLPRKHGSTDCTAVGEDINDAVSHYKRLNQSISLVRSSTDILSVLYWNETWSAQWRKKGIMLLEKIQQRISEFEYDYAYCVEDLRDEDLTEKKMALIFSYQSVKNESKPSLWECYTSRIIKVLFPSGISRFTKLYREIWDSPLGCCDIDDDVKQLEELLKKTLLNFLAGSHRGERKFKPKSEEEYLQAMTKNGKSPFVIVHFQKVLAQFIDKSMLIIIQDYMKKKYKQIREIL